MVRSLALLALLGASPATAVICFDFLDCMLLGQWGADCDRSGDNASLLGIIGTCVTKGAAAPAKAGTASLGGLSSLFSLGKRHGPDDDDDDEAPALVVPVTANATVVVVAAPSIAKRHGPDDDDDDEAPVLVAPVAVNATVVAAVAASV